MHGRANCGNEIPFQLSVCDPPTPFVYFVVEIRLLDVFICIAEKNDFAKYPCKLFPSENMLL